MFLIFRFSNDLLVFRGLPRKIVNWDFTTGSNSGSPKQYMRVVNYQFQTCMMFINILNINNN